MRSPFVSPNERNRRSETERHMLTSPHRLTRASVLALLVSAGAFTSCGHKAELGSEVIPEGVYIEEPAPPIEPTSPAQEDDARTNALEASCARGNPVACEELASATEPGTEETLAAVEATSGELSEQQLSQLAADCVGGNMTACDRLFWGSPVDSDYETLGLNCGGHADFPCADEASDAAIDLAELMAGLASDCLSGDREACDDLWWMSPPDSSWESLAEACGGNEGSFPCSF